MLKSAVGDGAGGYTEINYTYDARNQLIDFNGQATFAYDHDGRRISATANAVTTNYLWDEFSRYGDVILETSGANVLSYTLANGAVLSQTNNGVTHYLLPDAQNSTRAVVNAAGNITSSYDYDAFGNLQGTPTLETNYLYTGQQFDDVSGLYSLRARYYDPSLGRFLSRDTWAYNYQDPFELNRYVYVANNPATWSDPTGHMAMVSTSSIYDQDARSAAIAQQRFGTLKQQLVMRQQLARITSSYGRAEAQAIVRLAPSMGFWQAVAYVLGLAPSIFSNPMFRFFAKMMFLTLALDVQIRPVMPPEPVGDPDYDKGTGTGTGTKTDDDDQEHKKHITLGLNSLGRTTIPRPQLEEVEDFTDENVIAFNRHVEPLKFFTRRINDQILVNQNATAYYWDEWPRVGIATTDLAPHGFYEAISKVWLGEVEKIHFNLEGILNIPSVNSYSDFRDDGSWENYDVSVGELRQTSHEMFIISVSPFLCQRTIFYDGYEGERPTVAPDAVKAEICRGR